MRLLLNPGRSDELRAALNEVKSGCGPGEFDVADAMRAVEPVILRWVEELAALKVRTEVEKFAQESSPGHAA